MKKYSNQTPGIEHRMSNDSYFSSSSLYPLHSCLFSSKEDSEAIASDVLKLQNMPDLEGLEYLQFPLCNQNMGLNFRDINEDDLSSEGSCRNIRSKNHLIQPHRDERVKIWNRNKQVMVSGTAAPMRKNLEDYLKDRPHCEIYSDQEMKVCVNDRVRIWNRRKKKAISGTAAPMKKNLEEYLKRNSHCEVYNHQDNGKKRKKSRKNKWPFTSAERSKKSSYSQCNLLTCS